MNERVMCKLCGQPLTILSSVASDPHDAPAYHCECWPTDWGVVLMQICLLAMFIGLFYCLHTVLR